MSAHSVVGIWEKDRDHLVARLDELRTSLAGRGASVSVREVARGDVVFFSCGPDGQGRSAEGWVPIIRRHLAGVLSDLVTKPLTDRWLMRFLGQEARRRNFTVPPFRATRLLGMSRQLIDPPAGEGAGGATAASQLANHGGAANLLRWTARLSRHWTELLSASGAPFVVEEILWFTMREYPAALRRAARAAVDELATERGERWPFAGSWPRGGFWLGPPPRIYEVHVLPSPSGGYRLTDRWGMPAGRRWLGDVLGEAAGEDAVMGYLVRLNPRRIMVHAPEAAPIQAAVRSTFPGRVHGCRGCSRCALERRTAPTPSSST